MVLSCVPLVWEYVYTSFKQHLEKFRREMIVESASASTTADTVTMEEVEARVLQHFATHFFGGQLSCVGTGGAATRCELSSADVFHFFLYESFMFIFVLVFNVDFCVFI
jgi:hypothetical protein